MSESDITHWIDRLAEGDSAAEEVIWREYYGRLVQYARKKLADLPRRAFDEEDVALSAMNSFYRGVAAGRFERMDSRGDLWRLLVTITARKACAERRRHFAEKRGGGQVSGESFFLRKNASEERTDGIGGAAGEEPTPELACMVEDQCQRMLDGLGDESLRQVALLALEGYTAEEIAEKLGCVRRTVERKLSRIREKWSRMASEE